MPEVYLKAVVGNDMCYLHVRASTAIDSASIAVEPKLGITQKEMYTARELSLYFN